jgi:hypothetical protein
MTNGVPAIIIGASPRKQAYICAKAKMGPAQQLQARLESRQANDFVILITLRFTANLSSPEDLPL